MSAGLKARIAGALYLVVILTGAFAEAWVRGRLVVAGDPAATAHNLQAHALLFRAGFAAELVACVCNMPLALLYLDLFKVVDRSLALLVVFFTLVGTAIESTSLLAHLAPLGLVSDAQTLRALGTDQAQALARLSLRLFESGFTVGLVFFAGYCVSIGILIVRSTFLPRLVGLLMVLGGACYLVNSFATFLAPALADRLVPWILVPSGLGELSLCLTLLVKGVNEERWNERARAAALGRT